MRKNTDLKAIMAQGLIFAFEGLLKPFIPKNKVIRDFLKTVLVIIFFLNCIGPLPSVQAQDFILPAPGVMVRLSPPFDPPMLKGIKVHADNPFRFDFILDKGDAFRHPERSEGSKGSLGSFGLRPQDDDALRRQSIRLIKYFLASLTIPEKDLWVNLSPYEKNKIIPSSFGKTEMGRDLLAEDYMLKQITASLIYPEEKIGKKFWKQVYEEAQKKYGTTQVPVNTFNKVWIIPEKAVVYENAKAGTAYVVESKLKVMLEQDYLALQKNSVILSPDGTVGTKDHKVPLDSSSRLKNVGTQNDINSFGSQIVREVVIPELTKEVNEGKNFAQLRQVYNSLILATWYKKKIKDSILAQVYEDRNKVAGVGYANSVVPERFSRGPSGSANPGFPTKAFGDDKSKNDVEAIYQRYLLAFKKGVYNYIKEEPDLITNQPIPRKYFS